MPKQKLLKMEINSKAIESVAYNIVKQLERNSQPNISTWGDLWPDAHRELFTNYREDMAQDVITVLSKALKDSIE